MASRSVINGDGETSRDFCYIDNAVQANLLAATACAPEAANQVYNVAVGERTSLSRLSELLRARLAPRFDHLRDFAPTRRDFRPGDVRHSLADIGKARRLLGYAPTHRIEDGLDEAIDWYVADHLGRRNTATDFV
jgi:UDP-N-acetylglucosamine 4-epimerase